MRKYTAKPQRICIFFFQIIDEVGNPIPLSLQDARHLLADGRFVNQLNDGQAIRVSAELAEKLNLQVHQIGVMGSSAAPSPSITAPVDEKSAVIEKALEVKVHIFILNYHKYLRKSEIKPVCRSICCKKRYAMITSVPHWIIRK